MLTPIRLTYDNRYSLWNDLLRAKTDRLFVPTDVVPVVHDDVEITFVSDDLKRDMSLRATVVAVRTNSRRFQSGIYINVTEADIMKARRWLKLRERDPEYPEVRHTRRIETELEVRFIQPAIGTATTLDVSELGLRIAGKLEGLVARQLVEVDIVTPAGAVRVDAKVAWINKGNELAGLELDPLDDVVRESLRKLVTQLSDSRRPKKLVMVADDELEIVQLVSTTLSKQGYDVVHARSGDEALRLAREMRPRLAILDILMPRIDGSEVCKLMRADADLSMMPIIFMSALEPSQLHRVADESGATDYLSKPVRLKDLVETVSHYLAIDEAR